MRSKCHLILASQSPRRKKILQRLKEDFIVDAGKINETAGLKRLTPKNYVLKNAILKAKIVAKRHPQKIVLGVDTVGAMDKIILEKPKNQKDARRMLALLSGRTHMVYSGIALVHAKTGTMCTGIEKTTVKFRHLSHQEIAAYVATGEPMDKAAAYAIQGGAAIFVKKIVGDYSNIIGLPVTLFLELKEKMIKKLKKAKNSEQKNYSKNTRYR